MSTVRVTSCGEPVHRDLRDCFELATNPCRIAVILRSMVKLDLRVDGSVVDVDLMSTTTTQRQPILRSGRQFFRKRSYENEFSCPQKSRCG